MVSCHIKPLHTGSDNPGGGGTSRGSDGASVSFVLCDCGTAGTT